MRIAILAALPFPIPQGSQVFIAEQARALQEAGADVTLVCYGRGGGEAHGDFEVIRSPGWLTPRSSQAGPQAGKPFADAALLATLVAAQRRKPFDVCLAHNGEAAAVALAARPLCGFKVVYVAHTVLGYELSAYGPIGWQHWLDRIGRWLDRTFAARADGVQALCQVAADELGSHARGPLAVIPPGMDSEPAPTADEVGQACTRHGLQAGEFALYTGNLDRYQDLDELDHAARQIEEIPVVVATHDLRAANFAALRVARVQHADEMRALLHAARVALLPRRRPGGYPVKLLNYMEAARPIVARANVADGLVDGHSALLLEPSDGADALAREITRIFRDDALAEKLGRAARETLETRHAWGHCAEQTLELCQRALAG